MTHEALKRLRDKSAAWEAINAMLDDGRVDEAVAEGRRLAAQLTDEDTKSLPAVLERLGTILQARGLDYSVPYVAPKEGAPDYVPPRELP